eukprot:1621133-Rhodomonas_salina.1
MVLGTLRIATEAHTVAWHGVYGAITGTVGAGWTFQTGGTGDAVETGLALARGVCRGSRGGGGSPSGARAGNSPCTPRAHRACLADMVCIRQKAILADTVLDVRGTRRGV